MPIYVDPADGATLEFRRDGFSPAIIPHNWEPGLAQSSVTQTLLPLNRAAAAPVAGETDKAKKPAEDGEATKPATKKKDKATKAKSEQTRRPSEPSKADAANPPAAAEKPN
jgi:hypothetical protein